MFWKEPNYLPYFFVLFIVFFYLLTADHIIDNSCKRFLIARSSLTACEQSCLKIHREISG